jgi:AcrR family transcriptional regulator
MKKETTRPRGRPLSFDHDKALDAAVQVFWEKGYDAAAVSDLTKAMGINPPSLYAKFGSKHGLFLQAIDRYVGTVTSAQITPFMEGGDARQAITGYFEQVIRCVASENWPAGCLVVSVATEACERDQELRGKITELLTGSEEFIAERLSQMTTGAQVAKFEDPHRLARLVVSVGQSLATRARSGASVKELRNLADDFTRVLL